MGVTTLEIEIAGFPVTGGGFDAAKQAKVLIEGLYGIAGEAGRLMKVLIVGVTGVLEERGPGSIDNRGNDFM